MAESLFSYLVNRFSTSPENLATESLNFILRNSQVARKAFVNLLSQIDIDLPDDLFFETQAGGDDQSIPDLVGKDSEGNTVVLGEAKFWAGLTDNQPVTYLKRLQDQQGKLLIFIIFISPAKRFSTLYPELLRRCQEANFLLIEKKSAVSGMKLCIVNGTVNLVLISWNNLLNSMRFSLETEGEREMVENLNQLYSLCQRMDESAFLPLNSQDLTSNIGQRINQYCDLIDDVIIKLRSEGFISTEKKPARSSRNTYIRHFLTKKINQTRGCNLEFNPTYWHELRLTPIWLIIKLVSQEDEKKWVYDAQAKRKLVSLEMETPPRLIHKGEALLIPIFLKTGAEKPDVIMDILDQVKTVFRSIDPDSSW